MKEVIVRNRLYLLGLVVAATMIFAGHMVQAGGYQPGSGDDPLVTQSYVEQRNEQLKYYFDQKSQELSSIIQQNSDRISALEEKSTELPQSGDNDAGLEVVTLSAGQHLTAFSGTELILRSGQATAVQSELGGLSDVTAGKDIKQGEGIPSNHLLLVPRSDGRGVNAVTDCIFIVRGKYTIQ